MNKRGWLASGLLAAAVIGGYLGLLPLLSSLASGPAWPEPIATRDASGVVTAASRSPATSRTTLRGGRRRPRPRPPGSSNDGTRLRARPTARRRHARPDQADTVVVRVVDAGLERVQPRSRRSASTGGGTPTAAVGRRLLGRPPAPAPRGGSALAAAPRRRLSAAGRRRRRAASLARRHQLGQPRRRRPPSPPATTTSTPAAERTPGRPAAVREDPALSKGRGAAHAASG